MSPSMSPAPSSARPSTNASPAASLPPHTEDAQLPAKKRWPTLTTMQAVSLFTRLHTESLQKNLTVDPEETFKPKIGANSRKLATKVHLRENQGMGRLEFLVKNGTEKMRGIKKPSEQDAESSSVFRTIDPSEFYLDSMGRTGKLGDPHVRAVRREEDAAEARAECTFRPKLCAATIAIVKNTPYLKHNTFYARGLEWAQRKKRTVEASRKAREDEVERECTFAPRIKNQVID
jgi:hypothetical protein